MVLSVVMCTEIIIIFCPTKVVYKLIGSNASRIIFLYPDGLIVGMRNKSLESNYFNQICWPKIIYHRF